LNGTAVLPPCAFFTQPTYEEPTYPPRLPSAFTSPMTVPITYRGMVSAGIAQNGASAANGPGIARHINAYESQKCSRVNTLPIKLAPLIT